MFSVMLNLLLAYRTLCRVSQGFDQTLPPLGCLTPVPPLVLQNHLSPISLWCLIFPYLTCLSSQAWWLCSPISDPSPHLFPTICWLISFLSLSLSTSTFLSSLLCLYNPLKSISLSLSVLSALSPFPFSNSPLVFDLGWPL